MDEKTKGPEQDSSESAIAETGEESAGAETPAVDLRTQAESLRRTMADLRALPRRPRLHWFKKLFLALLLLGTLFAAVYLLIFEDQRRELIGRAGGQWAVLYPEPADELLTLPPPPPKPPDTRVEYVGPARYAVGAGEEPAGDESPLVYSQSEPSGEGDPAPAQQIEAPPEKTEQAVAAYNLLVEKSAVVARLVGGGLEGYEYRDWGPVKNDPPRFFIDIVVMRGGQELHLIYQVNLENGTVAPLSQAARDLQAAS